VALVEQWRHAAGEALVEIPAGTLDPEEDPAECALRELGEETGFTAGRLDHVVSFWSAPGFTTEKMYLFLARDLKPVQAEADEDERIDAFLVPWQEALAMCADGRIQDAKSIAGILSVQRVLSQDVH
jgi:ADP-ribose pyrophosphatase